MGGISLGLTYSAANQWWPDGTAFAADFINDRFLIDGVPVSGSVAYSFTRPSNRLAIDGLQSWIEFSSDAPARTDIGISIEDTETYYPTNADLDGAVLGTIGAGGVLPAGWELYSGGTGDVTISAVSSVNGLPAIVLDWDVVNNTGSTQYPNIKFGEGSALVGEDWSAALFYEEVHNGGDTSAACQLEIQERDAGNGYLAGAQTVLGAGGARQSVTRTLTGGTVASTFMVMVVVLPDGEALKRTITLVAPTLTKSASLSSPLATTNSGTIVRAADTLTLHLPMGTHDLAIHHDDASVTAISNISGDYVMPKDFGKPITMILSTLV